MKVLRHWKSYLSQGDKLIINVPYPGYIYSALVIGYMMPLESNQLSRDSNPVWIMSCHLADDRVWESQLTVNSNFSTFSSPPHQESLTLTVELTAFTLSTMANSSRSHLMDKVDTQQHYQVLPYGLDPYNIFGYES